MNAHIEVLLLMTVICGVSAEPPLVAHIGSWPAEPSNGLGVTSAADWLEFLEELLGIGNAFAEAVQLFEDMGKATAGNALINIHNLNKDTNLIRTSYHMQSGDMIKTALDVQAGQKQAITARGPFWRKSEGFVGWSLPNSYMKVVVYWSVGVLWSTPNKLGFGFMNSSNDENWLEELVRTETENLILTLDIHEYDNDIITQQHCQGDLCLQGTMTTDNHCTITIRFIPTNAKELFMNTGRLEYDQLMLDQVLNPPAPPGTTVAPSASSTLAAANVALVVVAALGIRLCSN